MPRLLANLEQISEVINLWYFNGLESFGIVAATCSLVGVFPDLQISVRLVEKIVDLLIVNLEVAGPQEYFSLTFILLNEFVYIIHCLE